jgi:hypothetical protein
LFEGTGNVVQESSSFSWNNTNLALSLTSNANLGASALAGLIVTNTNSAGYANTLWYNNLNDVGQFMMTGSTATGFTGTNILTRQANFINAGGTGGINLLATAGNITFNAGGGTTSKVTMFTTGNVGINTTADAGFKLDVNGTARVTGNVRIVAPGLANNSLTLSSAPGSANIISFQNTDATTQGGFFATGSSFNYGTYQPNQSNLSGGTGGIGIRTSNGANAHIRFYSGNADGDFSTEKMRIVSTTGNLLINTTTDVASSKLTIESTTQGFLPPRMTTTQRNAIASPATGLILYDTTLNKLCVRTASAWETITSL